MIRRLTRNLGLKLFSLAAAFALWLSYSGSRELTTSLPVSVQYRNIPKNLEISSNIVEQVHLILRGPAPLLARLSAAQLPVVIDLISVDRPGANTFTITRRNVALPAGIVLERAIPAQIQLRTEPRVSRDVPVLPTFENPIADREVVSWQITPPRLTVVGPKSRVEAIQSVSTDPVDLRAAPQGGEIRTAVFIGDPQVHFTDTAVVVLRFQLAPVKAPAPPAPKKH
jgi:YbbR domain-containing protein